MPVKIRLQRHGKKGKPFYWIVAADSRAKRDGKYLEKLGTYNPNTNPATIDLNFESSVKWLQNGAQPSDTARNILSYRGVMMKHHLLGGLRKGALTEEQVEEKFNAWLEEKESKISDKVSGLDKEKAKVKADALKAEKEINEKRIADATEAVLPETPEGEDASEEIEAVNETAPEPKAEIEQSEEKAPETEAKEETPAEKSEDDKPEAKKEDAQETEEADKPEAKKEDPKETEQADKPEAKKEDPKETEEADKKVTDEKVEDKKSEDKKVAAEPETEEVVKTPEAAQTDRENAEDNFAAPVVEKETLKETDGITEAPSVQEVVTDEDFSKKDADKPQPADDKKAEDKKAEDKK